MRRTSLGSPRCRLYTTVVTLAALVASGCGGTASTSQKPVAPPAPARPVAAVKTEWRWLQSQPASASVAVRFELVIERCIDAQCPVAIHLVKEGSVIDSYTLPWPSPSQETSPEDLDPQWGAGDPLLGLPNIKAFASGEETSYISMVSRSVRLSSSRYGVLVTQRAGWEHVKHQHVLLIEEGGKLRVAWTADEGAGPTWSSTNLASGGGETQHLLIYSGFQYPDARQADSFSVATLVWDEAQAKMVDATASDSTALQWVEADPSYGTITAAQRARVKMAECVAPLLWVVEKGSGGTQRRYVLSTLTQHADQAAAELQRWQHCKPPQGAHLTAYNN